MIKINSNQIGRKFEREAVSMLKKKFDEVVWLSKTKSHRLLVVINEKEKKLIGKLAEEDNRSVSQFMRLAVMKEIEYMKNKK